MIGTEEMNMGALCNLSGAVLSASAGLYEVLWLTRGWESAGAVCLSREECFVTDITENCQIAPGDSKKQTILVSFIMHFEVLYR